MIGYLFTNVATDEDKINVWKSIKNHNNRRIEAPIIEIESNREVPLLEQPYTEWDPNAWNTRFNFSFKLLRWHYHLYYKKKKT